MTSTYHQQRAIVDQMGGVHVDVREFSLFLIQLEKGELLRSQVDFVDLLHRPFSRRATDYIRLV